MNADERADRLAEIAAQLVGRVRDEAPADFQRWLGNAMADAGVQGAYEGLAIALACAVPVDVPWLQLTSWALVRGYGDGRPDTPEKIAVRRRELVEALDRSDPRHRGGRPAWRAA